MAWALTALLVSHTNNMIGELSCLKGLQGAKGYPFLLALPRGLIITCSTSPDRSRTPQEAGRFG